MQLAAVLLALTLAHAQVVVDDPNADRKTTKPAPTSIWVTGTDANGNLATTLSEFTQTFQLMYLVEAVPLLGKIGMGSIQGKVGETRTYDTTTVLAAAMSLTKRSLGESFPLHLTPLLWMALGLIATLVTV